MTNYSKNYHIITLHINIDKQAHPKHSQQTKRTSPAKLYDSPPIESAMVVKEAGASSGAEAAPQEIADSGDSGLGQSPPQFSLEMESEGESSQYCGTPPPAALSEPVSIPSEKKGRQCSRP